MDKFNNMDKGTPSPRGLGDNNRKPGSMKQEVQNAPLNNPTREKVDGKPFNIGGKSHY